MCIYARILPIATVAISHKRTSETSDNLLKLYEQAVATHIVKNENEAVRMEAKITERKSINEKMRNRRKINYSLFGCFC